MYIYSTPQAKQIVLRAGEEYKEETISKLLVSLSIITIHSETVIVLDMVQKTVHHFYM